MHVQRISHYCKSLAEALGLDAEAIDCLFHASPMHDIGKIAVPDAVLLKNGPLTRDEWTIMRGHCVHGARILERGESPYLRMGARIALHHHENWDGSGYPNGLSGEAIPLEARIVHMADHYDALRSKRPYKDGWSHERACDTILRGDGRTLPSHFDPDLLAEYERIADCWRDIFDATTASADAPQP
jgi:putative two-component system response regulator